MKTINERMHELKDCSERLQDVIRMQPMPYGKHVVARAEYLEELDINDKFLWASDDGMMGFKVTYKEAMGYLNSHTARAIYWTYKGV